MRYLIAVPCFRCPLQIKRVIKSLEIVQDVADVAIFDNCSDDDTLKNAIEMSAELAAKSIQVKVFQNEQNYGLGGSFKIATNYALENKYEALVWFHGDDQAESSDILKLKDQMELNNYDAVFGARFMGGASLYNYDRLRQLGNYFFNGLASIVLRRRIYEIGSGLNIYKIKELPSIEEISKWVDNIAFDINLLRHFIKKSYSFIPITWKEEDQKSTVSNMRVGLQVLGMLIIRRLGYRRKPGNLGRTRMVYP